MFRCSWSGEAVYYDAENGITTKEKTDIYLGVAVYNAQASSESVYFLLNAGAAGGSAGETGTSVGSPIADLGTLASDSGCAESMSILKEKINSILEALRSAGVIAAS